MLKKERSIDNFTNIHASFLSRMKFQKNAVHIAMSANEGYAPGLLVTIASAMVSLNPDISVKIHLLDGGLADETITKIERICLSLHRDCRLIRIPFDESVFTGFTLGPGSSYMVYARLLLGSLLDVDKVIYLDADILVLKDLVEVWELDMHGKVALVCKDACIRTISCDCPWILDESNRDTPYFNTGFMVMDLNQWRNASMESAALKLAESSFCKFWDQTILNYILVDKIEFLDDDWNSQSETGPEAAAVQPKNYHFVEKQKPWFYCGRTFRYKLWRLYYSAFFGSLALRLIHKKNGSCLFWK